MSKSKRGFRPAGHVLTVLATPGEVRDIS